MKILLIGGTGTLSTDTTQLCIEKGYEVYLFNRGNRKNKFTDKTKIFIGDINDLQKAKELLSGVQFDVVIDYLTFNVDTLKKRIELFKNKTLQYIFISTATVFPCVNYKISEDSPIGNDGWIYSKNKLLCEKYLRENKELGFHYTIVRPYLTYGDTRIPFPIISKKDNYNLLYRIENELPILMCGDGNQKITVTHTRDFAVGICGLFLNSGAFETDVNIVGDTVVTWNEIVHIIEQKLGKEARVVNVETKKLAHNLTSFREELLYDKAYSHVFDNKKIKELVPEFQTTIDIYDGMQLTIDTLNKGSHNIDLLWNATEDLLTNKFGKYKNKVSFENRIKIFRYESKLTYLIRKVKSIL